MDPTGSELGQDSSDDHSNRGRNGSNGNHRDTRVDNHSNGRLSGSDSNYRDSRLDNHSNRELQESKVNDEKENRSREVHQPQKDAEKTEICAICMDDITDLKKLDKCGHVFCRKCIDKSFKLHKPVCPSCGTVYGVTIGNMPAGTMNVHKSSLNIEGYKRFGSYCINYDFNSGIQGSKHPNAGVRFKGTSRVAYLPANPEGIEVCKMLKVAFRRRLTFTIGRSTTTGQENVVTWNDIHHKTSMNGGPTNFGYPDATYLSRIKEELASKGVTLADIDGVKDGDESITVK
ncbi:hypothetical protein LOTGIDRAFT_129923 [Lottia gigantea]|uniref:E3 ubiquitin-protein ligase n=1 Tax=Lottia gigantea TaxID=225164 RepID=V3ZYM7_LOTGI|nr:hypothetical protein LOTGIDRAFT_129923 [Lottia gigantea]ESO86091.1 hypothetical protein LOTGIDRAFT_129923 [Lottia gigantea]